VVVLVGAETSVVKAETAAIAALCNIRKPVREAEGLRPLQLMLLVQVLYVTRRRGIRGLVSGSAETDRENHSL
jgi:hypothetical protein